MTISAADILQAVKEAGQCFRMQVSRGVFIETGQDYLVLFKDVNKTVFGARTFTTALSAIEYAERGGAKGVKA